MFDNKIIKDSCLNIELLKITYIFYPSLSNTSLLLHSHFMLILHTDGRLPLPLKRIMVLAQRDSLPNI